MTTKSDKVFVDGMSFKKPREGAPEFVKGNISVLVEKFVAFAQEHQNENGWLNIDLKKSKEGKYYLELNTWKKPANEADDSEPQL